jgi:flavin reductase (DIM6/NTAB) family NADH-FMN oxidoreductase RutF
MAETDTQALAEALGKVPSGLFVLTARNGEAEAAMLASWVQQCAFKPPAVTVAVKQGRAVGAWLVPGARFTLNVLEEGNKALLRHFGKGFEPGQPAFEGIATKPPASGGTLLADALAYLDCVVTARHPAGDHDLIVATVVGGEPLREGRPMVHVRKSGLNY